MSDEGNREANIAKGCLSTAVFLIGIAIVLGVAFNSSDSGDSGRERSVLWQSYDVAIDVRSDGTLHVTERQDVIFRGSFSQGYAVIPLDRVESITNVQVTTEGRPPDLNDDGLLTSREEEGDGGMIRGTRVEPDSGRSAGEYSYQEEDGNLHIDYAFEDTSNGIYSSFSSSSQTRTIILEYDVTGAIRDYPDADEPWQQMHWMAISPEVTDIADIKASTVTVTLPEAVSPDELSYAPEPESVSGDRLVWSKSSMDEGDSFDVQVAFPAITAATAPDWQSLADQHDAEIEQEQNRQSLGNLMLLGAGILVVVGGGLALLYAWYTRIHESVAGLVPDILPEPPGDLPAGLVGTLVDEQVNPRDIAATILDLDRRGIVKIKPGEETQGRTYGRSSRYSLELLQPIEQALTYEQVVLRAVFRSNATPQDSVTFDALRPLFGAYREDIQTAMDEELVRRGYLEEMPETSRRKWRTLLKVFVGLTVVVAVVILLWLQRWTWWVLLPPALGYGMYLLGKRLTPSIARKTREGAETSARWSAFQRYLESTGGSIFGEEWKTISEKFMPWVVAFGIDHHWIGAMNTPFPSGSRSLVPASRPFWEGTSSSSWNDDRWSGRGDSRDWSWGSGSPAGRTRSLGRSSVWSGWDASRWSDMQGSSDSVLDTISSGSDSLFSMMGDAMEAIGSSSGSGGGSSYGGSSRSSGGSSHSGGRSHSSSGGGSRGFR